MAQVIRTQGSFPGKWQTEFDNLFELYAPVVEQFNLVLHPSFAPTVISYFENRLLPIEYETQESPRGMLDSILVPRKRIPRHRPTSIWITSCDQIAVQPQTVWRLVTLSEQGFKAALIFPTVLKPEPYIHIARDDQGEIVDILHQREGDVLPEVGESDMGLFCVSSEAYLDLLADFASIAERGAVTQERNFLSFIPWLHGRAKVRTFPAYHEIESVGINTSADLRLVGEYLRTL